MALEGTIKEFGLADIFQLIGLQKKTGILFLKGTDETVNIHFEEGMVVKVEESQKRPKYFIGRILINRGIITEGHIKEALEIQKSNGQRLGHALITLGVITKDQLREVLTFQMSEVIYKVFRWKGGDYKFYQERVDFERDTVVPISSEHILMEGIRMLDEWPIIERKLPSFELVLARTGIADMPEVDEPEGGDIFAGIDDKGTSKTGGIGREAQSLLSLTDGKKSIFEIFEYSPIGEFETCKALVELLDKGYIVKTNEKPEIMTRVEETDYETKVKVSMRTPAIRLEWLPFIFAAVALALIFMQVTGTRKIMKADAEGLDILKTAFAINEIELVKSNAVLYFYDSGKYPEKSQLLYEQDYIGRHDTVDPWGKPLTITTDSAGSIVVASADSAPKGHDAITTRF